MHNVKRDIIEVRQRASEVLLHVFMMSECSSQMCLADAN